MSKYKRHYTKEEKLQIVKEANQDGAKTREIAHRYNVATSTINRWGREFKMYENGAFPGNGIKKLTDEQKEIEILKRDLKESLLANEILKKALGIMSSPNRKNLLS